MAVNATKKPEAKKEHAYDERMYSSPSGATLFYVSVSNIPPTGNKNGVAAPPGE